MKLTLSALLSANSIYIKKSKFNFWSKIQKGDRLLLELDLSSSRWNVPTMVIKNLRTKEEFETHYNKMQNYLKNIDLTKIV